MTAGAVQQEAGTWEVKEHGLPYGLTAGPYGSLLALCWNRETDTVVLVLIDALQGDYFRSSPPPSPTNPQLCHCVCCCNAKGAIVL